MNIGTEKQILPEMRFDRLEVIRSTEDGQEDGVGQEVEPWEDLSLLVQVASQGLEADLQLLVDVTQHYALWAPHHHRYTGRMEITN